MTETRVFVALVGCLLAAGWQRVGMAQDCSEEADCPAGFQCEVTEASQQDCVGGAQDCAQQEPEVSRECRPMPIDCNEDGDCPAGLICHDDHNDDAQGCLPSADGDVSCPKPAPQEKASACAFAPRACQRDDECESGYECLSVGAESRCTSEPSNCSPGEACAPPEEICERSQTQICFPLRQDCDDDTDCQVDQRCVELPDDAPEGWEDATWVCMPEGIALLLLGQIKAVAVNSQVSEDANASGSESTQRLAKAQAEDSEDAAPGTDNAAGDAGCRIASPGGRDRSRSTAWPGVGVLLAIALCRRMTRRGSRAA